MRFAVLAPVALVVAACATTRIEPEARGRGTPATTAAPAVDGGTGTRTASPTSTWQGAWPKAWTDPAVVAELARDCAFVPRSGTPLEPELGDLFSCRLGFEQTCTPDPCFGYDTSCRKRCGDGCSSCGTTCVASCADCKRGCKDAACLTACATRCAGCKQGCVREMDRCATGTCNDAEAACTRRLATAYRKGNCKVRCASWKSCTKRCDGAKNEEACAIGCLKFASHDTNDCVEACGNSERDEAQNECVTRCFEAEPCNPFVCMMHFD